jgi:hypothetical protein
MNDQEKSQLCQEHSETLKEMSLEITKLKLSKDENLRSLYMELAAVLGAYSKWFANGTEKNKAEYRTEPRADLPF